MTNETTASQPNSIGDDEQFNGLLSDYMRAFNCDWTPTAEVDDKRQKLIAYIDSRAPAAQASATIQAAPVGWEPVYMTWDDSIMAWVDVGLAEYEAAEPDERRTTYQPAEVN